MAAVGGFTSILELKPEVGGFNTANDLLIKLYNNLKKIKDLAGNLGNMKLTIKLDNGEVSEASRIAQEERRKIAEQKRILREKEKEFKLHGGGVLNGEASPRAKLSEMQMPNERYVKESNKQLSDFASMIKWTIGVLATFKGALELGKAVVNNASVQSSILNQGDKFGMSPMAMLTMKRVAGIYDSTGNHDINSLDPAMEKLFGFMNDPALRGTLDTQAAKDLNNGLGFSVTSDTFNGKESLQSVMFRMFKGFAQAMKSKDSKVRSKAMRSMESLAGPSGLAVAQMLSSQGLDLETAYNNNLGKTGDPTKGAREQSIVFGTTIADFSAIWEKFMSQIGNSLLEPFKKINKILEDNREGIASFTQNFANIIGFLGSLVTRDIGEISKAANNFNESNKKTEESDALKKGFKTVEQYNRLKESGIINPVTNAFGGITTIGGYDFSLSTNVSPKQLQKFEDEYNRKNRLKSLSGVFGSKYDESSKQNSENNLAKLLTFQYQSKTLQYDELKKIIESGHDQWGKPYTGKDYDGQKLFSDILKFIQAQEAKEGKVTVTINTPDGKTQKQTISMKKAQSMNRDSQVAMSASLNGAGLA